MIKGIGIDVVEISRFSRVLASTRTCEGIFSEKEMAYINSKGKKEQTAAGIFAAKEALSKALGTGISKAFMKNCEITHNSKGKPEFIFQDILEEQLKNNKVFVSISHDGNVAEAVALIEEQ